MPKTNASSAIKKLIQNATPRESATEIPSLPDTIEAAPTSTHTDSAPIGGSPVTRSSPEDAPDSASLPFVTFSLSRLPTFEGALPKLNVKPIGRMKQRSTASSNFSAATRGLIRKHLVLPDAQIQKGRTTDHLAWLGHYCVYKRPDVIVCIGDFADVPSLAGFDVGKRIFEGKRYADDINSARLAMQRFLGPIQEFNKSARRDHKPLYTPELHLTLGNHEHRINRAVNEDAKFFGTISVDDLGYREFGWTVYPFLHPVVIDGVAYCHYFPSGPKGFAIGKAAKLLTEFHMSCVAGHKPGRDIAYGINGKGEQITGIISGSFYPHNEHYVIGPQRHWRGFYVLHEVKNGEFDEMAVSLNYLARKAKEKEWE